MSDPTSRLHLGDCLEVMRTLPDCSVDLVLCDLPYGTTACKWDTIIPFQPLWDHYRRLLKPRGAVVLTGSQPFTSMLVMSNLEWFKYAWVFVKCRSTGFVHAKNAPMKRHEDVLVFSSGVVNHDSMTSRRMNYYPQFHKGKPYAKVQRTPNVNGATMHHPSKSNLDRVGSTSVSDGERYPNSVLEFGTEIKNTVHPTQKPVALMEYLVKTYSKPGDTVLDNCMGSGTTGVACENTGRAFIGIERDPEYFAIAKARIEAAEPPLFRSIANGGYG